MAAVTTRFAYISEKRQDIIDRGRYGDFFISVFHAMDSTERPRRLSSYIVIRFPIDADPSLAKKHIGVHSARCFMRDGLTINRIVVIWSLPEPPPQFFDFLPCLPRCEVWKFQNDHP